MLIRCTLPDKVLFQRTAGTQAWPYIWEFAASDRLRLYSKSEANPWQQPSCCLVIRAARTGRIDEARRCNRFDLMLQADDPTAIRCELLIQTAQGLPYFAGPNLGFYLLPASRLRQGEDTLMVIVLPAQKQSVPPLAQDKPESPHAPNATKVAKVPVLFSSAQAAPAAKPKRAAAVELACSAAESAIQANGGRTNEDRVDESIAAVERAVGALRLEHDWDELPVREKIALLKAKIKQNRGISISNQTLYRDWIRPLW